jgi:hypothetical protein
MTYDEYLQTVSDMANAALVVAPNGAATDILRLVSIVAETGATLFRAGASDPVGHIERILSDDELVTKARDERDAALLRKFAGDEHL